MAKPSKPADYGVDAGTVFLGKYRVDAILGHGGMGVVALATHLQLEERVAIKFLRDDVTLDEETRRRFLREAQNAVKLKSEHVARVIDVGTFESGVPYMVMEYLEGVDLGQMLEETGKLNPTLAVELLIQACGALAEAHSLGIVHRDIKPGNLFVTWRADGSPLLKILDFGISKAPVGADMNLTQTQSLLGTPAYMSPEQMRSARTVDPRSDIWSLGTVLHELIEGRRPFEAESFSEMCVKVAVDPPMPLSVPYPTGLDRVIIRALEKRADARYQSIAEMARDLAPFARDRGAALTAVERMTRMLGRARASANTSYDRGEVSSPGSGPAVPQLPVPSPFSEIGDATDLIETHAGDATAITAIPEQTRTNLTAIDDGDITDARRTIAAADSGSHHTVEDTGWTPRSTTAQNPVHDGTDPELAITNDVTAAATAAANAAAAAQAHAAARALALQKARAGDARPSMPGLPPPIPPATPAPGAPPGTPPSGPLSNQLLANPGLQGPPGTTLPGLFAPGFTARPTAGRGALQPPGAVGSAPSLPMSTPIVAARPTPGPTGIIDVQASRAKWYVLLLGLVIGVASALFIAFGGDEPVPPKPVPAPAPVPVPAPVPAPAALPATPDAAPAAAPALPAIEIDPAPVMPAKTSRDPGWSRPPSKPKGKPKADPIRSTGTGSGAVKPPIAPTKPPAQVDPFAVRDPKKPQSP